MTLIFSRIMQKVE